MSWRDKVTFLTPNYIEHPVGGEPQKFWPLSIGAVFKLRRFAPPVAATLATLFDNKRNDFGQVHREVPDKHGTSRETIIEPIARDLAELRHEKGKKAWEELLGTFTDTETMELIAELIMDSLRLEGNDRPPAKEFMSAVPLTTLYDLMMGVIEANKGVLGPFSDQISQLSSQAIANVQSKMGDVAGEDARSETPTTDG